MTYPPETPEPVRRSTPVWMKVAAVGCGGILIVVLIVAGLVASNWQRLTGYYHQAKSTIAAMTVAQKALEQKYGATVHMSASRQSGVKGSILGVTLVNAPIMDRVNMDSADGRRAALDVAQTVRDALPADARYDHYDVTFRRERGAGGVSASGDWTFRFAAADLPPGDATGR